MPTVNVGIFVSGDQIETSESFCDYQIITQLKDLERVCQQAREADVVMLDTEFVRTRTYYSSIRLDSVIWRRNAVSDWPYCSWWNDTVRWAIERRFSTESVKYAHAVKI